MNVLDRMIGFISPSWGAQRLQARATMSQINAVMGSGQAGYAAAKLSRFNRATLATEVKEHALPATDSQRLIAESWQLYRDNPHARKIVSSLQSRVIGNGMQPHSLAMRPDGSPHVAFRERAQQVWNQIQSGFDLRGLPGKGGLTMAGLQRLALRSTILSGNTFYRLKSIKEVEAIQRQIPVPMVLQLIDASRLADEVKPGKVTNGNQFYRGLELDVKGQRVAYHFNSIRAGSTNADFDTAKRYTVAEIGHLFIEEDIDQYLGNPWFAAAILNLKDTGDLQYNVLKASAYAACFVGSFAMPTGATRFGLNASEERQSDTADGTDLTDANGNQISKLSPGLMINTGRDGKFELHSPNQPNMNPEAFVQHMLRSVSAAVPGVKPSTLHGDYRQSSYSSEKAADNDAWPEVEALQDWFATGFCQPIYEAVITSAVETGVFKDIVTTDMFTTMPHLFTGAKWQGPVARSINPEQDAKASKAWIQLGISSVQQECGKQGTNWRHVLTDAAELFETAEQLGLPEAYVNNILGIDTSDVTPDESEQPVEASTPTQQQPQDDTSDDSESPTDAMQEESDAVAV